MDTRALLAKKKLERKKAAASKQKKINSPFAEYDSLGKLKCRICLINIKHETLWNSHLSSRQHKLAIQRIKDEKNKLLASASSHNIPTQNRKSKITTSNSLKKVEKPSKENALLLSGYDSASDSNSDDDTNKQNDNEIVEDEPNRKRIKVSENNNNLPPGFFDNNTSNNNSDDDDKNEDVSSKLPAGFFDNKNVAMKEDENNEDNNKEDEEIPAGLPAGFFDKKSSNAMETTEDNKVEDENMTDLPSNFFDQKLKPKSMLDKEKIIENEKLKNEMELFEKEIQKETLNVDAIEEQEEDDFYDRRDKELEMEQEQYVSRMEMLKNRKQQLQENKIKHQMAISTNNNTSNNKKEEKIEKMDEDTDSDSDSDLDLENELYNWISSGL
jgi:hypothetical protein